MTEDEQKRHALNLMLDAWDAGLRAGVSAEALASAAIYAALTDMVEAHGEEPVAQMAAALPARLRAGEFTFKK